MVPTLDLRRLATRVLTRPQITASDSPAPDASADASLRPHLTHTPSAATDLHQAVTSLVRGQNFDNAFLSSASTPDERLINIIHEAVQVRRVFLWGENPYPFHIEQTEKNRVAREREYPEWWSDKIVWLPEDIEAVPRVVDLLITDHSPWTCRFVQPRCCVLIGDAANCKRDEDYRWTSGPGWLLGLRCRPRSRQAMNYRTAYSMNGGGENEDPFGWY